MFKRVRDAITGRFAPREHATARPRTTVTEAVLTVNDLQFLGRALKSARMQREIGLLVEAFDTLERAVEKVIHEG